MCFCLVKNMQTFDEFWDDVVTYTLETSLGFERLKIGFKYANGCGAKGGVKFPSTMYLIDISAACNIHDIEWKNSECYNDLIEANRRFNRNLKAITDKESGNMFTRWIRRMRVAKYVAGVELIGTRDYAIEREFEFFRKY